MIAYHGSPVSGRVEDVARFLRGRHAMVSFARQDHMPQVAELCSSFCLDNGAFTAWKAGTPITKWSGYYEFVCSWCRHPGFDFAVIPDVVGGSEEENDDLEAEWTYSSVWHPRSTGAPVWHLHESLDRLDRLVHQWPRVCLGSSGQWSEPGSNEWWERMSEAMHVACAGDSSYAGNNNGEWSMRLPQAKLHGLRMMDPDIFTQLPLSSADSTTASIASTRIEDYGKRKPLRQSTRLQVVAENIEHFNSSPQWPPLNPFLLTRQTSKQAIKESLQQEPHDAGDLF